MTTPHSAVPERSVVDRTLSILGAFDKDNRTLSLSDISRRAGLPVATVHRIVNKLQLWGALERSADGAYSIGLRLWETGSLAPRAATLAERALPHLVTLQSQSSAAAILAIRDGAEGVCLGFVSCDAEFSGRWGDTGRRLPLHATAVGLVLLAHASESVQKEVCSGPLKAYTPHTVTDGALLERSLTKVRREGHAVMRGTLTEERDGFGMAVRDSRGAVVAAVGVFGPVEAVQPLRLAPQVRAAADAVSRSLRGEGPRATEVGA
ncbi:IclR family transcriptional regulator [Streptomyces sp. GbtcB6]|uniref:IclR family transcriptional regulator n=1 Tax=Streptomyces sp. GbtcB6 TaxID=2824751 RepID=UPI001C30F1E0|nr:IclR family transcriptional regulator [Streptomyces sp. GbtcB6]